MIDPFAKLNMVSGKIVAVVQVEGVLK